MTGQTDDLQTEERAAAVERIELVVRKEMSGEGTGHDWWHVLRVRRIAERIAETEQCDNTLVSVAALLHDIADWKLNGGDEWAGPRRAQEILDAEPLLKHYGEPVSDIIHSMGDGDRKFKSICDFGSADCSQGQVLQTSQLRYIGATERRSA